MLYRLPHNCGAPCLAIAMLLAIVAADPARAGTGFDMNLSFSETYLQAVASGDQDQIDMVKHYEGWDSSLSRIHKRNMPFIELTNTSDMNIALTRFQMTIEKPEYMFQDDVLGAYAVLGTTTPGVSLSASSPDGGTTLVVDFLGGLAQGATVRFQVDIDPVDPNDYPYPDYRMVFFDVNSAVNDPSDNSQVAVSFASGPDIEATLQDYPSVGPLFVSGQGIRPYAQMDPVELFDITGQTVIPEPTSAVLLLAACGGIAGLRRRVA